MNWIKLGPENPHYSTEVNSQTRRPQFSSGVLNPQPVGILFSSALPARGIDENDLSVALEAREDPVVKLGVLAHPRVAIVDVGGSDVLVSHVGQHNEPLLEELCPEPGMEKDKNL